MGHVEDPDCGPEDELADDAVDQGLQAAFRGGGTRGSESVLGAIERMSGSASRIHLPDIPDEVTPVVRIPSADDGEAVQDDSRYLIIGEIARGGVGVVLKCRDRDLGREVAIKVLRSELTDRPEIVQRFVEEAQIGGQLQHPGVVPVYGLGVQPDGRPYFAMKLVKGQTLAALLKDRKDSAEGRRRFLAIFEQVCQTVAYAHARHVIHRDLKPANVLVGAFGQVQVVDWGFAKVLPKGGIADETPEPEGEVEVSIIETVRSGSDSAPSVAGSVMGTPAYMPPEQARGEIDRLDERADVFSLGAILTEILTGKPPYTGNPRLLLTKAAKCETADAKERLASCGADPALVALADRSLAPAITARPRDAGEVAQVVADYLAQLEERAREAELKAAAAHRTRKLTLALAAVILLAVVGVGGTVFRAERKERDRTAGAALAVSKAMEEAISLRGRARAADVEDVTLWPGILSQGERAVRLAESLEADEDTWARADELLESIRGEEAAAREAAAHAARDRRVLDAVHELREQRYVNYPPEKKNADFAEAFRELGIVLGETDPSRAARLIRETKIATPLLVALDDWLFVRKEGKLGLEPIAAIQTAADPDPLRQKLRSAAGDLEELQSLREGAELDALPVPTLLLLGESLGRAGDPDGAVAAYRAAMAADPGSYVARVGIAWWFGAVTPPRRWEGVTVLHRAKSLRHGRPLPSLLRRLALSYRGNFQLDSGISVLREAYREYPDDKEFPIVLCWFLSERANERLKSANQPGAAWQGHLGSAEGDFREAIEVKADGPHLWCGLAMVLANHGDRREAISAAARAREKDGPCPRGLSALIQAHRDLEEWDEAIDACSELIDLQPDHPLWPHCRGILLARAGRIDEAIEVLRAAIARHGGRSGCHCKLAVLLRIRGRHEEAATLLEERVKSKPFAYVSVALLARELRLLGKKEEASDREQQALDAVLRTALLPGSSTEHGDLAEYLLLGGRGREGAIRIYDARFPDATPEQQAGFFCGLGNVLLAKHRLPEAEECLREAIRRSPDLPAGSAREPNPVPAIRYTAQVLLGVILFRAGRGDEAIQVLEEARAAYPNSPQANHILGVVLLHGGRFEDALPHLEKKLERCVTHCERCRRSVQDARRSMELAPRLPQILSGELVPEGPEDAYLMGALCKIRGHPAKAHGFYDRALRSDHRWHVDEAAHLRVRRTLAFVAAGTAVSAAVASDTIEERVALCRKALEWSREGLAHMRRERDYPNIWFGVRLGIDDRRVPPEPLMITDNSLAMLIRVLLGSEAYTAIRDESELKKLPEDLQVECRDFWEEARAFLRELE